MHLAKPSKYKYKRAETIVSYCNYYRQPACLSFQYSMHRLDSMYYNCAGIKVRWNLKMAYSYAAKNFSAFQKKKFSPAGVNGECLKALRRTVRKLTGKEKNSPSGLKPRSPRCPVVAVTTNRLGTV